jgi:hypothetical protein
LPHPTDPALPQRQPKGKDLTGRVNVNTAEDTRKVRDGKVVNGISHSTQEKGYLCAPLTSFTSHCATSPDMSAGSRRH